MNRNGRTQLTGLGRRRGDSERQNHGHNIVDGGAVGGAGDCCGGGRGAVGVPGGGDVAVGGTGSGRALGGAGGGGAFAGGYFGSSGSNRGGPVIRLRTNVGPVIRLRTNVITNNCLHVDASGPSASGMSVPTTAASIGRLSQAGGVRSDQESLRSGVSSVSNEESGSRARTLLTLGDFIQPSPSTRSQCSSRGRCFGSNQPGNTRSYAQAVSANTDNFDTDNSDANHFSGPTLQQQIAGTVGGRNKNICDDREFSRVKVRSPPQSALERSSVLGLPRQSQAGPDQPNGAESSEGLIVFSVILLLLLLGFLLIQNTELSVSQDRRRF